MMKREYIVRLFFYIIGLVVLSFGIGLTIKADLGVGAWDAVNVGLSAITGLTVGNWVIIIGIALIALNAIIAKERPDYFALLTIFIVGMMIDFWLLYVMVDWGRDHLFYQAAMLVIGVLILGFGVSMYLQPKLSLNPIDGLMVSLQKRWRFSLVTAKTISEGLALVAALILGGPVGIGTILILLFIGPSIQYFEPKARKLMRVFLPS
ncbi:YczE/YyaS/YitT family protein [Sediminibacillus albus]|uniref:Membrane protein YczE n=1 Tax=Sediminibacillus albus TaxID=407036 RepID=A0A1G9B682_9BACI|nr:membrane protein [Sediminibacillus albus]SDK35008.1 hypothetical protein SAMN05216243_2836 [Sediminibacillus albus]